MAKPGRRGLSVADFDLDESKGRFVTVDFESTYRLWDTKDGDVFALLVGHEKYVYSLDISSDGRRLASGAGDETVRIWETWPYGRRAKATCKSRSKKTSP